MCTCSSFSRSRSKAIDPFEPLISQVKAFLRPVAKRVASIVPTAPFSKLTADSNAYDYNPGKGFAELRYRAYPSIHAAAAFATASALTAETARHSRGWAYVIGPVAYSLAALPGISRMYGDKHWASDVLMGAALGTVSGWATVRYHHHRPGNRLDRFFLGVSPLVAPNGELGLAWRLGF